MTINSTAAILLSLYVLVARQPGRGSQEALRHDSERHSEGIHRARHLHLSAAPGDAHHHRHVRLGGREVPEWNTISISGYHIREAGSTAVQEVAFTLGERHRLYSRRRSRPGSTWMHFAPRLSFFFNAHNNFLEEIAKFRAARRL